jgi:hypothetical protein
MDERKHICTHFVDSHTPDQLASISATFFSDYHMHPCRYCNLPQKIYFQSHHLNNHYSKDHCHSTRPNNILNSVLLTETFQTNPSILNRWNTALPWLADLHVTPPPFHESGFSRTTGTTRAATIATYGTIIKLVISSTPSLSDDFLATSPNTPSYERSASPFWKLLLLFEALIFQPESSSKELSRNVIRRLKLLANGHNEELHAKMMARPRSKPTTRTCKANIDEWNELCFWPIDDSTFRQPNASAQNSANHDNLCAAFQKTDHSLPIALNTDSILSAMQEKLYPPRIQNNPYPKSATRRLASMPRRCLLLKDEDLLSSLHQIQTGTSPGPYADSVDLMQTFALTAQRFSDPDKETVCPNLATLTSAPSLTYLMRLECQTTSFSISAAPTLLPSTKTSKTMTPSFS